LKHLSNSLYKTSTEILLVVASENEIFFIYL